jgi:hypothetical protein
MKTRNAPGHCGCGPDNSRCCKGAGECGYSVGITLDWTGNADLDLYAKLNTAAAIWYGHPTGPTLALNHDAHPHCAATPGTPEIINGSLTGDNDLYVWYNQWSDCEVETAPTIKQIIIANTGSKPIVVNDTEVLPGDIWELDTMAYAGYNTGAQDAFSGGTHIKITCGKKMPDALTFTATPSAASQDFDCITGQPCHVDYETLEIPLTKTSEDSSSFAYDSIDYGADEKLWYTIYFPDSTDPCGCGRTVWQKVYFYHARVVCDMIGSTPNPTIRISAYIKDYLGTRTPTSGASATDYSASVLSCVPLHMLTAALSPYTLEGIE